MTHLDRVFRLLIPALLLAPQIGMARPVQRLPDRVLTCTVRHITNFDPGREQTAAELQFDSVHRLVLHLPPIAKRTTPPPEAFEKPDPVDPRTRVLADPDSIAATSQFDRVVDIWPERVELAATLQGNLRSVIVINAIDATARTANVFLTRATELTHFDASRIYQGACSVAANDPATRRASMGSATR